MARRNIGTYSDYWLLRSRDRGILISGLDPQDAKRKAAQLGVRFGGNTWCLPIPADQMRKLNPRLTGRRLSSLEAAAIESMDVSALSAVTTRPRRKYGAALDRIRRIWARLRSRRSIRNLPNLRMLH